MLLLVESGSTKTDWKLLDGHNIVLSAQTDGINPYFQATETILATLNEQLPIELVASEVNEIFYYGTGITNDEKRNIVGGALKTLFKKTDSIEINDDMLAAARGLFGNSAGIAAILGTGSNSCSFNGNQITFQVPPLGFWLGDEGGGGHLGKTLVLSYLHKELDQPIRTKFEEQFGVRDRLTIIENAYQKPNPNRYFAAFAPFLLENSKDPQVSALIQGSFSAFFEKYLLKYPDIKTTQVGFVGSIAHFFENELREMASSHNIEVAKVLKSPMAGLINYHSSVL